MEDWEIAIAEAERLEKNLELIPEGIRGPLGEVLRSFSGFQKISAYKFMDLLHYDEDELTTMTQDCLDELFSTVSMTTFEDYVQLMRFQSKEEIENFAYFVNQLSWKEAVSLLKRCENPMEKHCRLCRSKRIRNLEFHIQHDLVPDKLPPILGTLSLYDKFERFQCEENRGYSFDYQRGVVYFRGAVVDFISICSNCIVDVTEAISSVNRFEPIFHLDAATRKKRYMELREDEQKRAILFEKICNENTRRRFREWYLQAIKEQRKGLKTEESNKQQQEYQLNHKKLLDKEIQQRKELITHAMKSDEKWKKSHTDACLRDLDRRQLRSSVHYYDSFHPPTHPRFYTLENMPVSTSSSINSPKLNLNQIQPSSNNYQSFESQRLEKAMQHYKGTLFSHQIRQADPRSPNSGNFVPLSPIPPSASFTTSNTTSPTTMASSRMTEMTKQEEDQADEKNVRVYHHIHDRNALHNRENPHSWRYVARDPNNLPLSPRTASETFGLSQDHPENHFDQLNQWKQATQEAYQSHVKYLQEVEQAKREIFHEECEELKDYIDERSRRLYRHRERRRREEQRLEEERIMKRRLEREERYRQRIASYEAKERLFMEVEDHYASEYRWKCWELEREMQEREDMFNEECEQCEVDRFFGFDLFEQRRREEIAKMRDFYRARVQTINEKLMMSKSTRNFTIRADSILVHNEAALVEEMARLQAKKKRRDLFGKDG